MVIPSPHGATDFLTKPFSNEELCLAVDKATRTHQLLLENHDLKEALDDRLKLNNVVTDQRPDPIDERVVDSVAAGQCLRQIDIPPRAWTWLQRHDRPGPLSAADESYGRRWAARIPGTSGSG